MRAHDGGGDKRVYVQHNNRQCPASNPRLYVGLFSMPAQYTVHSLQVHSVHLNDFSFFVFEILELLIIEREITSLRYLLYRGDPDCSTIIVMLATFSSPNAGLKDDHMLQ